MIGVNIIIVGNFLCFRYVLTYGRQLSIYGFIPFAPYNGVDVLDRFLIWLRHIRQILNPITPKIPLCIVLGFMLCLGCESKGVFRLGFIWLITPEIQEKRLW